MRQLHPPLKEDLVPLMKLCESLKDNEKALKQALWNSPDAEAVQQLRAALAILLHDLGVAFKPANAGQASAAGKLELEQVRKLCQALAVCVPNRGGSLIDARNEQLRHSVQGLVDQLLARAAKLGLEHDISQTLDILNLISRGLEQRLLQPGEHVSACLERSIELIAIWTGGDQNNGLLTLHNIGRCARQLSTVIRHAALCKPAPEGKPPSAATANLLNAIGNLCSDAIQDKLAQSAQRVVPLQNISTLLKDALDHKLISADDAALRPSLERVAALIGGLGGDLLLPLEKHAQPGSASRDCRPLVTFCNFTRELAERLSIRGGKFLAPPVSLQQACEKLIACINCTAFDHAKISAVQMANLISFAKLVDKLISWNPDKQTDASAEKFTQALRDAVTRLSDRLLKSAPALYAEQSQLVALLSGISHLGKHGMIRLSDELSQFCAGLLQQALRIEAGDWSERAKETLRPALYPLAERQIAPPAAVAAVLAGLDRQTAPTSTASLAATSPAPDDDWQQPKKTVKAGMPAAEVHSSPRLMVKPAAPKEPASSKQVLAAKKSKAKPTSRPAAGKPNRSKQHSAPVGPAQAIAAGDGDALTGLLRAQPQFDVTQVLEQALHLAEMPGSRELKALDTFFTQAEVLRPDTARAEIVSYFTGHPPQTAGLQTLLQSRGYLESPPELGALKNFDGMLNFLRTASDEALRRSAALPEFGRLLLQKDGARDTLLHKLVELGDARAIGRLLARPEAATLALTKNKSGHIPLHAAIARRQIAIASELLSHASAGDQALTPDADGCVPVMRAIEQNDDATLERLLALGNADKQALAVDRRNASALNFAATNENTFAAAKLLAMPSMLAQTSATDEVGDTAYARAARFGSTQVLGLLLTQAHAAQQLIRVNRDGYNVIQLAVIHGRAGMVRALLATPWAAALATAVARNGGNALTRAVETGSTEIVEQLLATPWASTLLQGPGASWESLRDRAANDGKMVIVQALDRFIGIQT